MQAYVVAKNEEANIERSVVALRDAGVPVTVLDSQSTDRTRSLAESQGARVETYPYTTHAEAYRYVTVDRTAAGEAAIVLDADMIVSRALIAEVTALLSGGAEVVVTPLHMYWNGRALDSGSLSPRKAIGFRGGRDYFEPAGHGERLRSDVMVARARTRLVHDDRKPFTAYLLSQARYALNLLERAKHGQLTWRDWLRVRTPIFVLATPFVSYFLRGGMRAGRTGLGYALDRLIAEAIMAREALASKHRTD